MKRTFALSTALVGVLAIPAFAGSPEPAYVEPAPMAPAAPAPMMSHDWTGGSVGAQIGYGQIDTEDPDLDGEDALYGLRANYDYDFGNYVLGAGLQYDAGEIDLDGVADVEGVLRAGVRAGWDFGQTMVYGTGGYAKAYTSEDAVGNSNGYYAGIGAERMLTSNVSLGGEVLYHQFNDFEVDDLEADATTAAISLNYRF